MNKTFIDKLAYICLKDGKILCTLSKGKTAWYIPGGKREAGESDEQALIREVREELSVNLIKTTVQKYGVFEDQADGKPEGTIVRMTCYLAEFSGELKADSEIEKIEWFNFSDKLKTSVVDHLIFDKLKKDGLLG